MIGYFGILEMELKSITEDLDALLRISILNPVTLSQFVILLEAHNVMLSQLIVGMVEVSQLFDVIVNLDLNELEITNVVILMNVLVLIIVLYLDNIVPINWEGILVLVSLDTPKTMMEPVLILMNVLYLH